MIVLIDNYDSFTYNIYQMMTRLLEERSAGSITVVRHDEVTLEEIEAMNPERLIISPGPGTPSDAGISIKAIQHFSSKIPILGVCLGHQALAEAFGGRIVQAKNIVHGKTEPISHDGKGVFRNLPNPSVFTRYHSLAVDPSSVPPDFEVSAYSEDGEIMGLRHKTLPLEGVQFHPESIGSEGGERLLLNFLRWKREPLERTDLLKRVLAGGTLGRDEAAYFMDELTDGALDDAYVAGMLAALAARGVDEEELAGCASVLVEKCRPVSLGMDAVDTCGTGGDGSGSFNISSMAAIVAASCGAKVAKHGNRAVSSKSGSTDFLAALGVNVNGDSDAVTASVDEHGFGYMAAPRFHLAMRHAAAPRKALGVRTLMNCLGPLANPAGASYRLIGVYDDSLLKPMARAAKMLGAKRVACVRSEDGLDEISPCTPTKIVRIDEDGTEQEDVFNPESLGIESCSIKDLAGGDGADNAQIARDLIRGNGPQAIRDAVCLNAGAALELAGVVDSLAEGYTKACHALEDGTTASTIEALRRQAGSFTE